MIRHWLTKRRLYEYFRQELSPGAQESVAAHLERCGRCRREADELRSLLGSISGFTAADARPDAYWDAFADGVDRRLDAAQRPQAARSRTFRMPHRREVLSFAGGVAVVLVAFAVWRAVREQPAEKQPVESPQIASQVSDTTGDRVRQYFRRSRVLLIGLANMEPEEEEGSLAAERRTSRELIEEARYLQSKPLDARAAKLIDDMETILIELANLEEEQGVSNVDLIRSGIHSENLLFKIRMAEETYATPRVLAARHTPERN